MVFLRHQTKKYLKMKKNNVSVLYFFSTILCILITPSYASFCPTNFNLVQDGDSIANVILQCGNPDKQVDTKKKAEPPQEWSYFMPQTVAAPPLYNTQGSLKTEFTFDASGKIINISVNGIGVGATTICNGYNLQLSDDRDTVKRVCGEPSFINKNANPNTLPPDAAQETTVTTLFYNSSVPPMKLIFENGKLTGQERQ